MGLFDTYQDEKPQEPAPAEFVCRIKSTRSGRQIMVCSVEPAPRSVVDDAAHHGFPLFVPSEIAQMADLDQRTVDAILLTKAEFPGCSVSEIIRKAAAQ